MHTYIMYVCMIDAYTHIQSHTYMHA